MKLGPADVVVERRGDGAILMRSPHPLPAHPRKLTERLVHWAKAAPDRVFLAQRDAQTATNAGWRTLTYAETLEAVRAIATALLQRDLSADRPVAILSGNDIEHALLALAAMHVGIPYAPISVPYSLMSTDFGKLSAIMSLLSPGLVFAANGDAFARAIAATAPKDAEIVIAADPPGDRVATSFAAVAATTPTAAVEAAHAAVTPDSIAKFLFTSGSTGQPKGVINTQRMLCANQAMIAAGLPFLRDEPPVVVDWLPWNHTFGSNHNFGLVLDNGGSLYIDEGKPLPGGIDATVRNLRDVAPTIYFNVPKGFEMLLPHLQSDRRVAGKILQPPEVMFYAGAGLAQHVLARPPRACRCDDRRAHHFPLQSRLDRNRARRARLHLGLRARRQYRRCRCRAWSSSWCRARASSKRGSKAPISRPAIGARRHLTADAFDAEGFYKIGDALKFDDPDDPSEGLAVRRPPRRGFQARHRHLGQRRAAARGLHRPFRAAYPRRGTGRRRPRRGHGADLSRRRRLPQIGARA